MMAAASTIRRLLLVVTALLLAIPLLRPAMSSALVTRGDALAFARDARARAKYALALRFDAENTIAADRYVFSAFLSRKPSDLEDAVRVAGAVLRKRPNEAIVRMDRALCLQLLRRYLLAARDFELVGRERDDVQALALAAADQRLSGNAAKSRQLLLIAKAIDPHYVPVRVALERDSR
jgi:Flp pilus assembly protein TadD